MLIEVDLMPIKLSKLKELWGNPGFSHSVDFQKQLGCICIDTRKLEKGDFFVPLVGKNYDGHSFLNEAFDRGVQGVVVSKDLFHVSIFSFIEQLL